MEGWKLNSGELIENNLTEQEIWQYFNFLFSSKSKNQASYKFGFIRSLLENIYNTNESSQLTYSQIFFTFTRVYWNLVVVNGLKQTDQSHEQSAIEKALKQFVEQNRIPDYLSFDSLSPGLQLEIGVILRRQGKRYVVGALYGDTDGAFYSFDNRSEVLELSRNVLRFMKVHQQVLVKLNNYELVKFIQAVNPHDGCSNLLKKVENITARSNLNMYREILELTESMECFYCERKLTEKTAIHVDHFIPWSFLFNDNLWNFVLSCGSCNTSKNNKLSEVKFLDKLINRNEILAQKNVIDVEKEFINYSSEKIIELFNYASINGFQKNWKPKIK
ncbi:HNH endonuclease signature motif containing protein [Paenibacillus roseipurpureus]|uniref:HNH endonuclease signature motif containing protein n=1 Tax=Paenibacillus roseopurpureus TaxID=2918901 RepID=A0AA96LSB3_9BACL|nr:HNH endonuclease signature motif containing protein [Paenibacillus sp. MBLB1832]WNR45144.1 HNH endonuclease signature motif containing protein [Paenibacillus sp. MBLB1832]